MQDAWIGCHVWGHWSSQPPKIGDHCWDCSFHPIQPGAYGLVVAHGIVSALVYNSSAAFSTRDFTGLIFYPGATTSGDATFGAFMYTISKGGLAGTYLPAYLASCARMVIPTSVALIDFGDGMAWCSVYLRLV